MKVITLVLTLFLSGCSLIPTVITKGSEVNDNAVKGSLFTLCRGASVGSIRREFNTPERAQTYAELCGESSQTLEKIVK